jgi:hypothetical protein
VEQSRVLVKYFLVFVIVLCLYFAFNINQIFPVPVAIGQQIDICIIQKTRPLIDDVTNPNINCNQLLYTVGNRGVERAVFALVALISFSFLPLKKD